MTRRALSNGACVETEGVRAALSNDVYTYRRARAYIYPRTGSIPHIGRGAGIYAARGVSSRAYVNVNTRTWRAASYCVMLVRAGGHAYNTTYYAMRVRVVL